MNGRQSVISIWALASRRENCVVGLKSQRCWLLKQQPLDLKGVSLHQASKRFPLLILYDLSFDIQLIRYIFKSMQLIASLLLTERRPDRCDTPGTYMMTRRRTFNVLEHPSPKSERTSPSIKAPRPSRRWREG